MNDRDEFLCGHTRPAFAKNGSMHRAAGEEEVQQAEENKVVAVQEGREGRRGLKQAE